jgi:hypothetical protein
MEQYDFISNNITLAQVKSIITKAGFKSADFVYTARVGGDGYLAKGDTAMSTTRLRNAAKALNIKVEISSPASDEAMADDAVTNYTVTINFADTTPAQLNSQGYLLYGFKAVQTSQKGGVPVVWFAFNSATTPFQPSATINWSEQYQGYITDAAAITNGQITAENQWDMSLGQVVDVTTSDVTDGGNPAALSLNNPGSIPYTCGISQMQGDTPNPLCAFPLNGNHMDVIAPIEKILLMFSTDVHNTGTVVEQAYSQAILIDLTSAQTRAVNYDINNGWSTPGGTQGWAQTFPPNSELVPMLIDTTSPSAFLRRRLR